MIQALELPQLPRHAACTLCDLNTVATSVGIPSILDVGSLQPSKDTPAVFLLGQNPGLTEDQRGLPFQGPSGQLLSSAYIDGISLRTLATLYLGNTARCFHVFGDAPAARHYKACRVHLLSDLATLSTTCSRLYVLCLGAPATLNLWALSGTPRMSLSTAFHRQLAPLSLSPTLSVTTLSTYHPAAVLRDRNLAYAVSDHLQILLSSLQGQTPTPSTPTRIPPRGPHP